MNVRQLKQFIEQLRSFQTDNQVGPEDQDKFIKRPATKQK